MAHDLRTPLAPLRVLVEAIGDESDPEELGRRSAARAPRRPATGQGQPRAASTRPFNLITNAIQHTPETGTITVGAEARDDVVEVEVADDGEGVTSADRDRLFDRRGGTGAAGPEGGGGLGLAICRAIVEAHGGQIWFGDSPVGTKVRFSVPVAVRAAGLAATGSGPKPGGQGP